MTSGRTERLLIDPLVTSDADELFAALDHPDVGIHLGGPEMTTVEALRDRIGHLLVGGPPNQSTDQPTERWLNWVVRLAATDAVVGRLEATTYGQPGEWGEVAYIFDPRQWGHGYAVEAGGWMIDHLRDQGVRELWAAIDPANARSIRLIERLQFQPQTTPPARPLGSYDDGDLVFRRGVAPLR